MLRAFRGRGLLVGEKPVLGDRRQPAGGEENGCGQ